MNAADYRMAVDMQSSVLDNISWVTTVDENEEENLHGPNEAYAINAIEKKMQFFVYLQTKSIYLSTLKK